MIRDTLNSVRSNIHTRLTNPFLGTFVIVWIIRNYRVCFAVFNFDKQATLEQKLNFISTHYPDHSFILGLIKATFITLGVLCLTYIFLLISRLITDFYEKQCIPQISSWTGRSSIVMRDEHESVLKEVEDWKKSYEQERESRLKYQNQIRGVQINNTNEAVETKIIKNQIKTEVKGIAESDKRHEEYLQKLRNTAGIEAIKSVLDNVDNKRSGDYSYHLYSTLEKDGMINLVGRAAWGGVSYEFTPKGVLFFHYMLDHYYDKDYDGPYIN